MKKACVLLLGLMALSGCARGAELVRTSSVSTRTGIFEESPQGGAVASGFAELGLFATLKTHRPGSYSASDLHGTPDYQLLLNIDGQAVLLEGKPEREDRRLRNTVDAEVGDGIRYRFGKNLRLKPGVHRVVAGLPADGIAVEKEINLPEGSANSLVLEPIYGVKSEKKRVGFLNSDSFKEGITSLRFTLNGKTI